MKKTIINILAFLILIFLSDSCGLDSPGSAKIRFISSETSGCLQEISINQKSDEGILTWIYDQGNLTLFVHVDTHCDSQIIDDVITSKDEITINWEDTVADSSGCICRYRIVYKFNVEIFESVKVRCYFKSFDASSPALMIDRKLSFVNETYTN